MTGLVGLPKDYLSERDQLVVCPNSLIVKAFILCANLPGSTSGLDEKKKRIFQI